MIALFAALLFTALIEGALMLLLFRRWDFVYYSALCNLMTNPALNFVLYLVALACLPQSRGVYIAALFAAECAVVLVEARVYRRLCRFERNRALGVSLLLNAASFCAGLPFM